MRACVRACSSFCSPLLRKSKKFGQVFELVETCLPRVAEEQGPEKIDAVLERGHRELHLRALRAQQRRRARRHELHLVEHAVAGAGPFPVKILHKHLRDDEHIQAVAVANAALFVV